MIFWLITATSYIVEAVLGRTVHLPCDIESNVRDDRVYMVLWFKYKASKPFYRSVSLSNFNHTYKL